MLLGLVLANAVAKVDRVDEVRRQAIRWVGDNTSALAWAETDKAASKSGQMANVAVIWAQLYGKCSVDNTEHLAGAKMGDIDEATRHKVLTSLHQKDFVNVTAIPGVIKLFHACDPSACEALRPHHEIL